MGNHIFPGNRKCYVNRIKKMVSFELGKEIEKGARDQTKKHLSPESIVIQKKCIFC